VDAVDGVTAYAIAFLAVLVCLEWWASHGRCKRCNNDRVPRCGCDPNARRKPWKNSGK
jgi:hypothetical protein